MNTTSAKEVSSPKTEWKRSEWFGMVDSSFRDSRVEEQPATEGESVLPAAETLVQGFRYRPASATSGPITAKRLA